MVTHCIVKVFFFSFWFHFHFVFFLYYYFQNKALVADGWQKENSEEKNAYIWQRLWTDGRTDQATNRPTNVARCGVAVSATKKLNSNLNSFFTNRQMDGFKQIKTSWNQWRQFDENDEDTSMKTRATCNFHIETRKFKIWNFYSPRQTDGVKRWSHLKSMKTRHGPPPNELI